MGRLLDDLRTLSLADAGALTLHREPADLAGLAREVVAAQGPVAAAKGVALVVAGDPRLVASVDPVRFREIVGEPRGQRASATRRRAGGSRWTCGPRRATRC